jgi:hypothetical protein
MDRFPSSDPLSTCTALSAAKTSVKKKNKSNSRRKMGEFRSKFSKKTKNKKKKERTIVFYKAKAPGASRAVF